MDSDLDVIFEFHSVGNSVRVSAFHIPSMTEIFIVTPANISKSDMEQAALQKLRYVLGKSRHEEEKLPDGGDGDFFV